VGFGGIFLELRVGGGLEAVEIYTHVRNKGIGRIENPH
jgi:hypothetical protein